MSIDYLNQQRERRDAFAGVVAPIILSQNPDIGAREFAKRVYELACSLSTESSCQHADMIAADTRLEMEREEKRRLEKADV